MSAVIDPFELEAYAFELPPELIAQHPKERREEARLLVIDRQLGTWQDRFVYELPQLLRAGDQIVYNDTKVIPARLRGRRPSGGQVELLLLEPVGEGEAWWALARPGRKLPVGATVLLQGGYTATITAVDAEGRRQVVFDAPLATILETCGEMPLPPYIERAATEEDKERYQTIFATHLGAAAAPTAGLHFSPELMATLTAQGIASTAVTLHTGVGTFRPISCSDVRAHPIHHERCLINEATADFLNQPRPPGSRRLAIGTTTCRTLESFAREDGTLEAGIRDTNLFIYPGYRFKSTEALLTNFHLPRSSLLLLVAAFVGYDTLIQAYQHAIAERYRFFSYGDAMLIL